MQRVATLQFLIEEDIDMDRNDCSIKA